MKKNIVFATLTAFLLPISLLAQDDTKSKIEGSGNVVTKDIAIQSFDELDVKGVFSLILTQGDKESVKIEAEDNLQPFFEVSNHGSKLLINMKKDMNYQSKKKMKVYVTFRKLKGIELKTVGDVSSANNLSFDNLKIKNKSVGTVDLKLTAQSLDVENKSVGNVRLDGKVENVVIHNTGVGSIQAGNFVAQKMDIENTGVGSAEVNAEKELKVRDSMLGKVSNKGGASVKRVNKVVI